MAGSHRFSSDNDQHDPKIFKESLGSFGTTTNPMAQNQLAELQTRIRQGVKHVELHLANSGKGQFNTNETPDKYGFEQRRTIMQLAKLNKQTLSVHGTFAVNSFSGFNQNRGFDEVQRANNMKEIDETLKFAAETAKGGAVVFHLHETGMNPTPPGEINLPDSYLKNLKKENPKEYKKLMENYLEKKDFNRPFLDNPDLEVELKIKFENLKKENPDEFAKLFSMGIKTAEDYYKYNKNEQIKLQQEGVPIVVVGSSIAGVQRSQNIIDIENLNNLNSNEKNFLESRGIDLGNMTIDDFQKIQAIFTNGVPAGLDRNDFLNLKKKVLVEYEDLLDKNNGMMSKTDKEFFQKTQDMQIKIAQLQKEDFERNFIIYENSLEKIKKIEKEERRIIAEINLAKKNNDFGKIEELRKQLNRSELTKEEEEEAIVLSNKLQNQGEDALTKEEKKRLNEFRYITQGYGGVEGQKKILMSEIGQLEYQKLEKYDEYMAQLNDQIKKSKEQKDNAKVLTDEIFEKNVSAIGHLGIKALRYQLDLKEKSKIAKDKVREYNLEIKNLREQYENTSSNSEKIKLADKINKVKYEQRKWVGVSDYKDIDVVNKPLYLAPENIMAGYGYMDSLEEFKAAIRTSWDEFSKKILSNEGEYKKIREDYEKETGIKITSKNAMEIAKKHIGGTFDNAHAGVWLKYFKREAGESEEHRIERFNKWLNQEAEDMAREGIIKHVHFNDTQAKDDDHNLLGQGILDIHDLRHRLRNAGIKEALIVEPGGRNGGGGAGSMHLLNAFEIFNPSLAKEQGYVVGSSPSPVSSGVSDWVSVQRDYNRRPQYSHYGLGYSGFRHNPPQNGNQRGGWSGTGFF